MTVEKFFDALQKAGNVAQVQSALGEFEQKHKDELKWVAIGGKENNRGVIEVSTDPGRSLVERITNGIDAILEAEHLAHGGKPDCRSPREAATAWLNVPAHGLSGMTTSERRQIAKRVVVTVSEGDSKDSRSSRTVEVRDFGIGIKPQDMRNTILSLNESNKLQKHYLAGTYGQGGSSTFVVSKYVLITSRYQNHPTVGFTLVRFDELDPDLFKTGHYVYLTLNGSVLQTELPEKKFQSGTQTKHFGYDLSRYPSPLGPNSVYGLLNEILFDTTLPIWFDNQLHDYRRVIKGSRNALNGALDEGEEKSTRGDLSHAVPMFYVELGDFGRVGVEYWVLDKPNKVNKKPSAAFVNPSKPVILTLNGQNHAELSGLLIRKDAELPYLTQRFIVHINCDNLTSSAKRALFVSNREDARRGIVYDMIENEIIRILKSDDELTRLNNEAREHSMREQDESALLQMRNEVAKLLRIYGLEISQAFGGEASDEDKSRDSLTHPRRPRPKPVEIDLHDPPTYIKLLWEEEDEIGFYPEQRRYIRIETDADSSYHNPGRPDSSRVNVIVDGEGIKLKGTTPLSGGRMRAIVEAVSTAKVGFAGKIRVELSRPGLTTLSDERAFVIVKKPATRESEHRVSLPPFEVIPVDGPDDEQWIALGWPDNINTIASSAEMNEGKLTIHYSRMFPKFANTLKSFELRDTALATSFAGRYELWLAIHSLLYYQDQQKQEVGKDVAGVRRAEEDPDILQAREREERCRIATLASIFAAREVETNMVTTASEIEVET